MNLLLFNAFRYFIHIKGLKFRMSCPVMKMLNQAVLAVQSILGAAEDFIFPFEEICGCQMICQKIAIQSLHQSIQLH